MTEKEKALAIAEIAKQMTAGMENIGDIISKVCKKIDLGEVERVAAKAVADITAKAQYAASIFSTLFADLESWIESEEPTLNDIYWLSWLADYTELVLPFVEEELERMKEERGVTSIAFSDFIRDTDPDTGEEIESPLERCINRALETQEEQEAEALSEIPKLNPLRPRSYVASNTALVNNVQEYLLINAGSEGELIASKVKEYRSPKTKKRREISYYTVISEEGLDEPVMRCMTGYETTVLGAVTSLWEEAERQGIPAIITVDQIFRAMPGSGIKPTQKQKKEIIEAVESLRRMHIYADVSEELAAMKKIKRGTQVVFDDYCLSMQGIECSCNDGRETIRAYQLHAAPILYQHAQLIKQIITIPAKCIELKKVEQGAITEKAIAMTKERQVAAIYIIKRIAVMKNDKKRNGQKQKPIILFDTIFRKADIAEISRDKAHDFRNFCFEVLDYEVAVGYIKGYQKRYNGRKLTGVEIIL